MEAYYHAGCRGAARTRGGARCLPDAEKGGRVAGGPQVGPDGMGCNGAEWRANPGSPAAAWQVPSIRARDLLLLREPRQADEHCGAPGGKGVGAGPPPRRVPLAHTAVSRERPVGQGSRCPEAQPRPREGCKDPRKAMSSCLCLIRQDLFQSPSNLCHWQPQ